MTKAEWMARCDAAWETGRVSPESLHLLKRWCEMVNRMQGGQIRIWFDLLEEEKARTNGFSRGLAGDTEGYDVIQLAAQLAHHCQQCAEDPHAWHTRAAFCDHGNGYCRDSDGLAREEARYWVCGACGLREGKPNNRMNTWHEGMCGWCGRVTGTTNCGDYGLSPKEEAHGKPKDGPVRGVDTDGEREAAASVGVQAVRAGPARHRHRAKPRG